MMDGGMHQDWVDEWIPPSARYPNGEFWVDGFVDGIPQIVNREIGDAMSETQPIGERIRSKVTLRATLIATFRVALFVAGGSLAYLLFIFGHTDVTPMRRILLVAALGGTSALIAAMLQWIGLPVEAGKKTKGPAKK
jgi:hypothetical protein